MEIEGPFSHANLNEIFKISSVDVERVVSRESSSLEFKESFGWASLTKYLKTSAAYANTKGGYIVFGIANNPRFLRGLSGSNLKLFKDIDPERMSCNFNEHFAPEVVWDIKEYELQGKTYGLLYIHEAKEKPVVCTKDADNDLKEGDIYYRYRGRSQRIKYPELRAILEAKREAEQRLWMHHLENIARIGVRDAGIFDLHTGNVTGSTGSFLIDESLLSQLAFIKEGEFSETKGKPALKLIGHVEPIDGRLINTTKKQIVKGIRLADIILAFLCKNDILDPEEYIQQICFESTALLPVYYFIKKSKTPIEKIIEVLESVVSRTTAKKKLIKRLKERNTQYYAISNTSTEKATLKKREYVKKLCNHTVSECLVEEELNYFLQAIRGLTKEEIKSNSEYINELLRHYFSKCYASAKGTLANNLRRAICWVDEALNMRDCR